MPDEDEVDFAELLLPLEVLLADDDDFEEPLPLTVDILVVDVDVLLEDDEDAFVELLLSPVDDFDDVVGDFEEGEPIVGMDGFLEEDEEEIIGLAAFLLTVAAKDDAAGRPIESHFPQTTLNSATAWFTDI